MVVISVFMENLSIEVVAGIVKEAAGLMVTDHFTVIQKGTVENVVTTSDLAVQEFLVEMLSAALPGCGFLCEEEGVKDTGREYVWVIDPIDGTMNYARGINECSICVGLMKDGEIVMGVVYSPARGEMYTAEKGHGAFCNGRKLAVSERPFRDGIICTAMSTYRKEYAKACNDIIFDIYMRCNDFRRFGAAAIEICMLAAGIVDLYFEMRLQPWDFAAAMLILQEAGGCISGYDGKLPPINDPCMVVAANNQDNLNLILETVHKYVVE